MQDVLFQRDEESGRAAREGFINEAGTSSPGRSAAISAALRHSESDEPVCETDVAVVFVIGARLAFGAAPRTEAEIHR